MSTWLNSDIGNIIAIQTGKHDVIIENEWEETFITINFPKKFSDIPVLIMSLGRAGYTDQTYYQLNRVALDHFTCTVYLSGGIINNKISIYWCAISSTDTLNDYKNLLNNV